MTCTNCIIFHKHTEMNVLHQQQFQIPQASERTREKHVFNFGLKARQTKNTFCVLAYESAFHGFLMYVSARSPALNSIQKCSSECCSECFDGTADVVLPFESKEHSKCINYGSYSGGLTTVVGRSVGHCRRVPLAGGGEWL